MVKGVLLSRELALLFEFLERCYDLCIEKKKVLLYIVGIVIVNGSR
jgi:hypothetical protein